MNCTEDSDIKPHEYIFMLDKIDNGKVHSHCHYYIHDGLHLRPAYLADTKYPIRLATEKEKQKLLQAIKEYGYKWNSKTKTWEKLIIPKFNVGDIITNGKTSITIGYIDNEYYYGISKNITNRLSIKNQDEWNLISDKFPNKFDITTLKPFDKVLVRLTNNCIWKPKLFSHYNSTSTFYPFIITDEIGYPQCIPYEGNEHLAGKIDNCSNFYKVWE